MLMILERKVIQIDYINFSKNHGLHLIMKDVVEGCPAWESGVRPGDVIVTVNDWLIVLMDRPQVTYTIFCCCFSKFIIEN